MLELVFENVSGGILPPKSLLFNKSDFKFVNFCQLIIDDDDDDNGAAANISPVNSLLYATFKYVNCDNNPKLDGNVPTKRFFCTLNTSNVEDTAMNNSYGIVPYKLFESLQERKKGRKGEERREEKKTKLREKKKKRIWRHDG